MALGERRRNPLRPRSTAEGAAALRAAGALERDPAVRCPDDLAAGFLGGFNVTTLAKRRLTRLPLLWRANRALPGAYPYEIARCKFIDDVMSSELDVGLDELVLLGAGLDSRPYRFADRLGGLRVFEVDHPASQATKRARLHRLFGEEPRSVRFVPVDFNRDDLVTEMTRAGHDERAATLFIWSGVSPYLSEAAVTAVLTWVGNHTSPRKSIISTPFGRAPSTVTATATARVSSNVQWNPSQSRCAGASRMKGSGRRSSAAGSGRRGSSRTTRQRRLI